MTSDVIFDIVTFFHAFSTETKFENIVKAVKLIYLSAVSKSRVSRVFQLQNFYFYFS